MLSIDTTIIAVKRDVRLHLYERLYSCLVTRQDLDTYNTITDAISMNTPFEGAYSCCQHRRMHALHHTLHSTSCRSSSTSVHTMFSTAINMSAFRVGGRFRKLQRSPFFLAPSNLPSQ